MNHAANSSVVSLAQLLAEQPAEAPPCWIQPGLLPPEGILFVGGEPKVGKSLLVANLALALAAGCDRAGFTVPAARRVMVCQFELPAPQFVARLAAMRQAMGSSAAADNLLVDTRASGHLLSSPQGLNHFLNAARAAAAEVIVLDPLYSAHDQDEIARDEIGRAFRGSSALHAVGDSYLLLTRPSAHLAAAVELRFQFRYTAAPPARLLHLDPRTLWFSPAGQPAAVAVARRKVENEDVRQALTGRGERVRYNQLREQVMQRTECSKRTAQLAIAAAVIGG